MTDDIAINKTAIIRRCLERIHEEWQNESSRLDDFTIQDSVILNLLRACEASIDLAMHRVAVEKLGIPQHSRDSLAILFQQGKITKTTAQAMKNMVGFRNIAVHSYQSIQRPILEAILREHLVDFETFITEIRQ